MMRAQGRTKKGRTPQQQASHGAGLSREKMAEFEEKIMSNRPGSAWGTETEEPRKKWKPEDTEEEALLGAGVLSRDFEDEWSPLPFWEDSVSVKEDLNELRGINLIHGGDSGVGLKKRKNYDVVSLPIATGAIETIRRANQVQ